MFRNYSIIIFVLLAPSGAFSQSTHSKASDSIISHLYQDIEAHKEIDRDIAIKYLHLDSSDLQSENADVRCDSLFSVGSHRFAIITYAAMVNCQSKLLVEYKKELNVFKNWLLISHECDFDLSGDHTSQIHYKFKDNKLYVYNNYYKIKNEDLKIVKKESTYSVYGFPNLNVILLKKTQAP